MASTKRIRDESESEIVSTIPEGKARCLASEFDGQTSNSASGGKGGLGAIKLERHAIGRSHHHIIGTPLSDLQFQLNTWKNDENSIDVSGSQTFITKQFRDLPQHLIQLNISDCPLILGKRFDWLPQSLETLIMRRTNCSDYCMKQLPPALKYLDVTECQSLSSSGIQRLKTSCPQLETIILDGCPKVTQTAIHNLSLNLKELSIRNCNAINKTAYYFLPRSSIQYLEMNMPQGEYDAKSLETILRNDGDQLGWKFILNKTQLKMAIKPNSDGTSSMVFALPSVLPHLLYLDDGSGNLIKLQMFAPHDPIVMSDLVDLDA
eukprot:TRINITY_DN7480_c0_g1_i1.p1 TRINITY_DN7480_c0_g1~~TRINITY_DN7480_c0_g1_i1.p1  ORF type:complete len:320 (-),score=75.46 TRINITY_DN7480_c0_g1_i1:19-978(-)